MGDADNLIKLNQAYQNKFIVDEKTKAGEMPLQAFYQQDSASPVESGLANATAVVVVSMK